MINKELINNLIDIKTKFQNNNNMLPLPLTAAFYFIENIFSKLSLATDVQDTFFNQEEPPTEIFHAIITKEHHDFLKIYPQFNNHQLIAETIDELSMILTEAFNAHNISKTRLSKNKLNSIINALNQIKDKCPKESVGFQQLDTVQNISLSTQNTEDKLKRVTKESSNRILPRNVLNDQKNATPPYKSSHKRSAPPHRQRNRPSKKFNANNIKIVRVEFGIKNPINNSNNNENGNPNFHRNDNNSYNPLFNIPTTLPSYISYPSSNSLEIHPINLQQNIPYQKTQALDLSQLIDLLEKFTKVFQQNNTSPEFKEKMVPLLNVLTTVSTSLIKIASNSETNNMSAVISQDRINDEIIKAVKNTLDFQAIQMPDNAFTAITAISNLVLQNFRIHPLSMHEAYQYEINHLMELLTKFGELLTSDLCFTALFTPKNKVCWIIETYLPEQSEQQNINNTFKR